MLVGLQIAAAVIVAAAALKIGKLISESIEEILGEKSLRSVLKNWHWRSAVLSPPEEAEPRSASPLSAGLRSLSHDRVYYMADPEARVRGFQTFFDY